MAPPALKQAYRYCEWITAGHYENFPVASRLLPASLRPDVAAIYAFARSADDFADERKYEGRSLELLAQWRAALWACSENGVIASPPTIFGGRSNLGFKGEIASSAPSGFPRNDGLLDPRNDGLMRHPIFIALADTIRRRRLPVQLLDDLLTAFTMDVTKRRYEDWEDLLGYCRYSANPVGRLVLTIFGVHDPKLHEYSDRICTALQLANHWQDLRLDFARDILYIPQSVLREYEVTEEELKSRVIASDQFSVIARRPASGGPTKQSLPGQREIASSAKDRWRTRNDALVALRFQALMAELVHRARRLFDEGAPLVEQLPGRLRLEIRLTLLGGRSILDRIESSGYDVFRRRPTLSAWSKLRLLVHATLSR